MKKLLVVVAILALASTAMAGNYLVDTGKSGYIGTTTLNPGGTFVHNGVLYADAWEDWEAYGFICVGSGTFTASLEDCCIMGDTMIVLIKDFLTGSFVDYDYCTSPCVATASVNVSAPYGVYLVIVGYLDCPGGYAAGFTTSASFM